MVTGFTIIFGILFMFPWLALVVLLNLKYRSKTITVDRPWRLFFAILGVCYLIIVVIVLILIFAVKPVI